MSDTRVTIKDSILDLLDAGSDGAAHPTPPSSYFMSSIETMAMSVFEKSRALTGWMEAQALDPHAGPDCVLALGLLLTIEGKANPRPVYEHFDYPDDHDH